MYEDKYKGNNEVEDKDKYKENNPRRLMTLTPREKTAKRELGVSTAVSHDIFPPKTRMVLTVLNQTPPADATKSRERRGVFVVLCHPCGAPLTLSYTSPSD